MELKLNYRLSKAEKIVILLYIILISISCVLVFLKPFVAPTKHISFAGLFEAVGISLTVYIVYKYIAIYFIRVSTVLWGKSSIWEYRKKFVLSCVHFYMFFLPFLD